jgi:salicylate hydroxylase
MYRDIEEKLAAKRGTPFTERYFGGLPFGLELPSGIVGSS